MDAVIEAKDLVKAYTLGGAVVRALNGVSLTVGRGEMVAVTGASGSGIHAHHILGCLGSPDSRSYVLGADVSLLTGNRLAQSQPVHRARVPDLQPAAAPVKA